MLLQIKADEKGENENLPFPFINGRFSFMTVFDVLGSRQFRQPPHDACLFAEAYPIGDGTDITVIQDAFFILLIPYLPVCFFQTFLHLIELFQYLTSKMIA